MKPTGSQFIVAGVLVFIVITALFIILPNLPLSSIEIKLGNAVFTTRLAVTQKDREKGLSGVAVLDQNQAFLMAFPSDDKWGVWMKDMLIPIDIIWLNQNKQIIHIVKNAKPTDSTNEIFKPKHLSRYVIELPAGSVDKHGIMIDSVIDFDVKKEIIK